jgi:hypothetical protein
MKLPIFILVLVAFAPLLAGAEQAYKWTDEKGQVHYGGVVPQDKKAIAKPIATGATVSDNDRKTAEERVANDKENLKKLGSPTASASSAALPAVVEPSPSSKLTCDEAWKAYNESYVCMDPYRSGGRLRPEAFDHCKQAFQPQNCPLFSGP